MTFETKDSGKRLEFESGMVRDVEDGKTNFLLVFSGPMFERWAELLTRGAVKYSEDNWMLAQGAAEMRRFRKSATRHFVQWLNGDTDEDHAAAVFFNINGYEYVREKMLAAVSPPEMTLERAKEIYAQVEAEMRHATECDGIVVPPIAEPELPDVPVDGKVYMLADGSLVEAVWSEGRGRNARIVGKKSLFFGEWPDDTGKFSDYNWGYGEGFYLVLREDG